MTIIKGYKIRLYPTKEQEELFLKHIGCCRYIYNYLLECQNNEYKLNNKHISRFDMMEITKNLKYDGQHDWLQEIANASLQIICTDMHFAFQNFFNGNQGYPKFKSKHKTKLSFPTCQTNVYFRTKNLVNIEKCGKVKCKTKFNFPLGRFKLHAINPRISLKNGKWILSFALKYDNQVNNNNNANNDSMGIDLGVKKLAVVSFGNKQFAFNNINRSKKMKKLESQIKHVQRNLARKYRINKKNKIRCSNRYFKEVQKYQRLCAKQTNIRNNYIHQITRFLINQHPKRIVMEDLNVRGMMKNKYLAKSISEQKFYEFKRQIKYKCKFEGIEFVLADRFYPSSKTCSNCGHIKKNLKLNVRIYKCPICKLIIDRDLNAAKNLEKYNT